MCSLSEWFFGMGRRILFIDRDIYAAHILCTANTRGIQVPFRWKREAIANIPFPHSPLIPASSDWSLGTHRNLVEPALCSRVVVTGVTCPSPDAQQSTCDEVESCGEQQVPGGCVSPETEALPWRGDSPAAVHITGDLLGVEDGAPAGPGELPCRRQTHGQSCVAMQPPIPIVTV
jgi:hypothetical protein